MYHTNVEFNIYFRWYPVFSVKKQEGATEVFLKKGKLEKYYMTFTVSTNKYTTHAYAERIRIRNKITFTTDNLKMDCF